MCRLLITSPVVAAAAARDESGEEQVRATLDRSVPRHARYEPFIGVSLYTNARQKTVLDRGLTDRVKLKFHGSSFLVASSSDTPDILVTC